MVRILTIILALSLTSCASWAKVHYDEKGRIAKIEYSAGQDVEVTEKGFKGSNKFEPFKEVVNISGFKN